VPMLAHGDEISRTQQGNNNAYCQDNELTWVHWDLTPEQKELLDFTKRVIQIRKSEPVFQRRHFFQGRQLRGNLKDLMFLEPSGQEMNDEAWNAGFVRSLGVMLAGDNMDEVDEHGDRVVGHRLLLLLNAHHETIPFAFPALPTGLGWEMTLDTAEPHKDPYLIRRGVRYDLKGRSTALFKAIRKS